MSCGIPFGGQQGGRRRSGKSKKMRMTKKTMRGGNFYDYGGALDGMAGIPKWGGVVNLPADAATGRVTTNGGELQATQLGGRRRRGKGKKTARKGGRKGRRYSRRRAMRGGASWVNPGQVGYGYAGTGAGGLADAVGYPVNVPGGGPSVGADGVSRV